MIRVFPVENELLVRKGLRSLLELEPELAIAEAHFAAFAGNPAAVRVLLDHGADLEKRAENRFENTPLLVSLLTGDRATVRSCLIAARSWRRATRAARPRSIWRPTCAALTS